MDNSDLIQRLLEAITALNTTLQQTHDSQERLADSVNALRRAKIDEAREEQQGLGLLGYIFGGALIGTMIGLMIGERTRSERKKRKD